MLEVNQTTFYTSPQTVNFPNKNFACGGLPLANEFFVFDLQHNKQQYIEWKYFQKSVMGKRAMNI